MAGYSHSFSFGQMDSLLCFVWRKLTLSFLTALFTGRVPPLPALHLQVASWSDKLRQSRGCGSLNQHSLHAFSASSPFFLQRQRKRPQLPTCQEEMSHRQPLDFYQRLFCGSAPRPVAQTFIAATETHLKAALCVILSSKSCPLYLYISLQKD